MVKMWGQNHPSHRTFFLGNPVVTWPSHFRKPSTPGGTPIDGKFINFQATPCGSRSKGIDKHHDVLPLYLKKHGWLDRHDRHHKNWITLPYRPGLMRSLGLRFCLFDSFEVVFFGRLRRAGSPPQFPSFKNWGHAFKMRSGFFDLTQLMVSSMLDHH